MKKKNLKSLSLKKNVISNLSQVKVKGGGGLSGGSWCCTLAECPPLSYGCPEQRTDQVVVL